MSESFDPDYAEQVLDQHEKIAARVDALAEQLRQQHEGDAYIPPDQRTIDSHRIAWDQLLAQQIDIEDRWLIPGIVARGRNHSLIAAAGAGKSEMLLWHIARAAQGIGPEDQQIEPVTTLYLDWEMGPEDLQERMLAFGYQPGDDLSRLVYLQPPEIEHLDTRPYDGEWPGQTLAAYATDIGADLVIIDTFSRSVAGEENSNDTVRDFYRYTGGLLKAAGIAQVRLDHEGHAEKGRARGGSAKAADIDVSITLTSDKSANRSTLTRGKARMSWWPEELHFIRHDRDGQVAYQQHQPTGYVVAGNGGKIGDPGELADVLRALFPTKAPSYDEAYDTLAAHEIGWKNRGVLREALRSLTGN